MKMSTEIREYIVEKHIDIEELSKKTGVKKSLLLMSAAKPLNASELLAVCACLQVAPEDIWQRVQDAIHS